MRGKALLMGVLCLRLLSPPAPAWAAPPDRAAAQAKARAKVLLTAAERLMARQRYQEAREKVEEAMRIFPNPSLLYSLGVILEKTDEPAAMRAFQRFLAARGDPAVSPRAIGFARKEVARLEARLGRIVVSGSNATFVQVDDEPRVDLSGDPIWVKPGAHRLRFDNGVLSVEVSAGDSASVLPPPPSPEAVAAAKRAQLPAGALRPKPPRAPRKPVDPAVLTETGWIFFGAGLAIAAAGAVLLGVNGRYLCSREPGQLHCPYLPPNTQVPGIVLTAAGAPGVLTGVSLLIAGAVVEPPQDPRPSFSAGLSISGRF